MCMLFAVSSKTNFEANAYLKLFYANSPQHPHGWGLAYLRGGRAIVKKEPIEAGKSAALCEILGRPIRSKLVLAHIRYATIGNVDPKNCHPFWSCDSAYRQWTLMHNGTIFDYPPLSPYIKKQKGETDSERVFLYLMDVIDKTVGLSFGERFDILSAAVSDMAKNNKLNLIFTDGEYLYVHTNLKETLFYLETESAVIFATAPLDSERWRQVPFCTLLAYKDGELVKAGVPHENEYVENMENVRLLYRIFANL